jgi:hypothetical protein
MRSSGECVCDVCGHGIYREFGCCGDGRDQQVGVIGSWLAWVIVLVAGCVLVAATVGYAIHALRGLRQGRTRVLVVAVSDEVAEALRRAARGPARRRHRVEAVGVYSRIRLLLVQADAGDGVATARKVVAAARPDYVIVADLGRGLYPQRQDVGCLVVADSLVRAEVVTPGPDDPPGDPKVHVVGGLWASWVLGARMRVVPRDPGVAYAEGAVVCCRPSTTTWWTMSEDLGAAHRAAVTAAADAVDSYATAAADHRACAGWVGVFGVAYFAQRRAATNDRLAADTVARTIVRAATVGAFDTIHRADSPPTADLLRLA